MKAAASQFLTDIIFGIEKIKAYVGAMTYEDFVRDEKTADAVMHKLEIIGEATKNLPAKLRKHYREVPWTDMAGLRDKIAHFYFGIDYKVVWDVVKNKLPAIKTHLESILSELEGGSLFEKR